LDAVFNKEWILLVDLDLALINQMRKWLKISTPTLCSSELSILDSDKTGRLVEICRKTGITEYISGPLCKDYMDCTQFKSAKIEVLLHHYHHPEYQQRYPGFEPYLSCLDLLFNEGAAGHNILYDPTALAKFEI